MRTRFAIPTGCALAALALQGPALATTFVLMGARQLTARSDAAVIGRVTRIQTAAAQRGGSIYTYVHISPATIVFGEIAADEIVLRERGGQSSNGSEWVFGSPEYTVGEQVFVFLHRNDDGTLRTTAMAMGKYRLSVEARGTTATRDLGPRVAVLDPGSGHLLHRPPPQSTLLPVLIARVRTARAAARESRQRRPLVARPPELDSVELQPRPYFSFVPPPHRWFEPDAGNPVAYLVDSTGDEAFGPELSLAAIDGALAAWSEVPTSAVILENAGPTDPALFSGCPDDNRIVFNDPFHEITDPSDCRGILALGGFCPGGETRTVNGITFRRIVTGKLTFNNGWSNCPVWTPCNLAEIATHEIGHTIGLGHSEDETATMATFARFDGRCTALADDDIAGVTFAYPLPPTPTETPTATPSVTPSPPPTETPTQTSTPTRTRIPTRTRPPTRTPTLTRTRTRTRTPRPTRTATRTRTPTRTITPTRTRPPTRTVTGTRTPSPTESPSRAPTPSRTTTPTRTRVPTRTYTAAQSSTPTRTYTATPAHTSTATPSATPTPPSGTFLELLLRALERVLETPPEGATSGRIRSVDFLPGGDGHRLGHVTAGSSRQAVGHGETR